MCSRGGELGGGGKSVPFSSQEEVSFPRAESAELQRLRGLERAGKVSGLPCGRRNGRERRVPVGPQGGARFLQQTLSGGAKDGVERSLSCGVGRRRGRSAGGHFGGRQRCGGSAGSGPLAGPRKRGVAGGLARAVAGSRSVDVRDCFPSRHGCLPARGEDPRQGSSGP